MSYVFVDYMKLTLANISYKVVSATHFTKVEFKTLKITIF